MTKLFSIKEQYSERIYSNQKLVEFRRQNVNVDNGEFCLIYTSSPIKSIEGYFIVEKKMRLPLEDLWKQTKDIAGISLEEFTGYFEGCKLGTAIVFKKAKKLPYTLSLKDIQKKLGNSFRPPQSYYNLNNQMKRLFSPLIPQKQLKQFIRPNE